MKNEKIEKFFLKQTENIAFIELKKGTYKAIGNFKISDSLPLPIMVNEFLNKKDRDNIKEEISIEIIIDGIIYLLGIDSKFKYNDIYKEILYSANPNIEAYILYKALKLIENKKFLSASIYLRCLLFLDKKTEVVLFNYGLSLENLYKDDEMFFNYSTNVFEEILNINENFALAYYKLGYHYKETGQFMKAELVWEKYLILEDNLEMKNQVREELFIIKNDVKFEEAILDITKGQFNLALESLLDLSKTTNWWNIYYLIGICYKYLNKTEEAIEYFNIAIEKGGDDYNLYNEIGLSYFLIGDPITALKFLEKAIKDNPSNFESYYNKGLIYNHLGEKTKSFENISIAYELNPEYKPLKEIYFKLKESL